MTGNLSHVPRQVRDLVARGEAALQQATPTEPPGTTPAAPVETAPPTPAAVPPVEAAPAPAATTDSEVTWEQRYRSLQGMFNRSQREHQDAVEKLSERVAELTTQVAKANVQPAPAPAPLISDADRQEFGAPIVDLVERGAKHSVMPAVQQLVAEAAGPLRQQVDELQKRLDATQVQQTVGAEELFFMNLDKARPDWEQVNASPSWLAWLAGVDPMTQQPRQAHLDAAIAAQDLRRTVAIFEAFRPQAAPAPTHTQAPPLSVAPSTVGSTVMPTSRDEAGPTPVTRTDISKFYQDISTGRYAARPKERDAMEAKINAAVQAGRVID